jgi:hypothetical protein
MSRWLTFARERFDPVSHLTMIALFCAAHVVMAAPAGGSWRDLSLLRLAAVPPGVVAFFFLLRLYDEEKDYEHDRRFNPGRPLARGLVTRSDLHIGMVVCIAIVVAAFAVTGWAGLATATVTLGYSLLMYREFFIGSILRPHLTTYAVMHTAVLVLLSLAVLCGLTGKMAWELGQTQLCFALNSWFLFNIFEFGRKSFLSSEEVDGVDSYSRIFSRPGAVALVLLMALVSLALLWEVPAGAAASKTHLAMIVTALLLTATGVVYAALDRPPWGKLYRFCSSLYIVVIYAELVIGAAL